MQDLLLAMRLASAAGQPWLLQNGALAAWNAYVQLLQRQRYAELAGVLLPLLRQLLKVSAALKTVLSAVLGRGHS